MIVRKIIIDPLKFTISSFRDPKKAVLDQSNSALTDEVLFLYYAFVYMALLHKLISLCDHELRQFPLWHHRPVPTLIFSVAT